MSEQVQTTTSTEVKAEPVIETPVETPVVNVEAPAPAAKEEPKPAEVKPIELKLTDGSKLDKGALDETLKLAQEKGWSQEYAQSYLDAQNNAIESYSKRQQETFAELNDKTWKAELLADKEVGGAKFEESGILASKAILKFGGQEFHDAIIASKLNFHPGLFKFAVNVAKAMADDQIVQPGAKSEDSNLPLEQQLYPTMFNNV